MPWMAPIEEHFTGKLASCLNILIIIIIIILLKLISLLLALLLLN